MNEYLFIYYYLQPYLCTTYIYILSLYVVVARRADQK